MKTLTRFEKQAICNLYRSGKGSIHGFAAHFGVSIKRIKELLDEYGIEHGKRTGYRRQWIDANEITQAVLHQQALLMPISDLWTDGASLHGTVQISGPVRHFPDFESTAKS